MFVFFGLLGFSQLLSGSVGLRHSEFWIYPAQTILCGALLLLFRRCCEFHGLKTVAFTLLIGFGVFVIWIALSSSLTSRRAPSGSTPTP